MKLELVFLIWIIATIPSWAQDTTEVNNIYYNNVDKLFYSWSYKTTYTGYVHEDFGTYFCYKYIGEGSLKYITYYYSSGSILKKENFGKYGEEEGIYVEYHENGKRKIFGKYLYGDKRGIWKYWTESGNLCKIERCNAAGNVIKIKFLLKDCI